MLTYFLRVLVQSWDSASGQMAPVPPTVWLSKGHRGVFLREMYCIQYVCIEHCRSLKSLSLKNAVYVD